MIVAPAYLYLFSDDHLGHFVVPLSVHEKAEAK